MSRLQTEIGFIFADDTVGLWLKYVFHIKFVSIKQSRPECFILNKNLILPISAFPFFMPFYYVIFISICHIHIFAINNSINIWMQWILSEIINMTFVFNQIIGCVRCWWKFSYQIKKTIIFNFIKLIIKLVHERRKNTSQWWN